MPGPADGVTVDGRWINFPRWRRAPAHSEDPAIHARQISGVGDAGSAGSRAHLPHRVLRINHDTARIVMWIEPALKP